MELAPPLEAYIKGQSPSHSPKSRLGLHIKAWSQEQVEALLEEAGYLQEGRPTKRALQDGLLDTCEGKALWNLKQVKAALVAHTKPAPRAPRPEGEAKKPLYMPPPGTKKPQQRTEPAWVDLGVIGTYFGVSSIIIGRWLTQLGYRAEPKLKKNESGAVDMLDVANQAKKQQASGFRAGKEPTQQAFDRGLARTLTVTNHKKKEVEIVQWNLDLVKAVLVRAGHELDTERKMMLKGRGKNGDVQVTGIDKRAQELFLQWRTEYQKPGYREASWRIFNGQPTALLMRVEAMLGRPGFIRERRYLTEELPF